MVNLRMTRVEFVGLTLTGHITSRATMMLDFIQGRRSHLPDALLIRGKRTPILWESYAIEHGMGKKDIKFVAISDMYGDTSWIFRIDYMVREIDKNTLRDVLRERLGDDFDRIEVK